jgi:hypothetical protein
MTNDVENPCPGLGQAHKCSRVIDDQKPLLLGICMICIELVAWRSTKQFVTEKVYRQVFCNEYNISFHRPKKDQCVTCNQYKQKEESGNIDESTKQAYQEHQRRKLQGCQEKKNDKRKAKENKTCSAATLDLKTVR